MSTQKKMLSFEELEAQAMWQLPDRELMHVHKGGSHSGGSTTSTSTSTTTTALCSQDNSHSGNALLQTTPLFAPVNVPILSCNTVTF